MNKSDALKEFLERIPLGSRVRTALGEEGTLEGIDSKAFQSQISGSSIVMSFLVEVEGNYGNISFSAESADIRTEKVKESMSGRWTSRVELIEEERPPRRSDGVEEFLKKIPLGSKVKCPHTSTTGILIGIDSALFSKPLSSTFLILDLFAGRGVSTGPADILHEDYRTATVPGSWTSDIVLLKRPVEKCPFEKIDEISWKVQIPGPYRQDQREELIDGKGGGGGTG